MRVYSPTLFNSRTPRLAWAGLLSLSLAAVWSPSLSGQSPGGKPDFSARTKQALDKARPALLRQLQRGHGGELALLCLAAVHDGVPRDHQIMVKAMQKLSRAKLNRTYDVALRLMVAAAYPALPNRNAILKVDLRNLMRNIVKREGFGYDPRSRRFDMSNTQYGALGLRAAFGMGQTVPAAVWKGLLSAAIQAQNENGGFGYTTGGRRPTVSMTAGGIAVMQVCADHLDAKSVAELAVPKRLIAAFEFLIDHKGEIGDRKTENSFYFHYGLERACILTDREHIDGKDWYRAGAEMLMRAQLRRGGWHSAVDHLQGGPDADGADAVSTSFAVLFLRRKFRKIVGPITPRASAAISQLTAQSTPAQVGAAVASAIARGRLAMPAILRALRSSIKTRRVAAAKAMMRITGEDFGYNPHVVPEKSRAAVTKAELWWLRSKRKAAKK